MIQEGSKMTDLETMRVMLTNSGIHFEECSVHDPVTEAPLHIGIRIESGIDDAFTEMIFDAGGNLESIKAY